jgi:hypothetical protein
MHANNWKSPNKNPTRLHLQVFKLRSAGDGSATIDPHEWDIITSPCLYSVRFPGPVHGKGQLLEGVVPGLQGGECTVELDNPKLMV